MNMTLKDLKNFIYTKIYIPIYRQILIFDNKNISNEKIQLRIIDYSHFEMKFKDIPHKNNFIDIKVEDYRRFNNQNNTGNFILRIDLFKDIMNQICEFKKYHLLNYI